MADRFDSALRGLDAERARMRESLEVLAADRPDRLARQLEDRLGATERALLSERSQSDGRKVHSWALRARAWPCLLRFPASSQYHSPLSLSSPDP